MRAIGEYGVARWGPTMQRGRVLVVSPQRLVSEAVGAGLSSRGFATHAAQTPTTLVALRELRRWIRRASPVAGVALADDGAGGGSFRDCITWLRSIDLTWIVVSEGAADAGATGLCVLDTAAHLDDVVGAITDLVASRSAADARGLPT